MLRKIIPVIVLLGIGTLAAAAELSDGRRPSASSYADTGGAEPSADIALYTRLLAATRAYQEAPTTETARAFQLACNQLELYLTRKNISGALAQWNPLFTQEMSPQKLRDIIQLAEIYLATSSGSDSDNEGYSSEGTDGAEESFGKSPGSGPLPATRPAGLPNLNLARLGLYQDPSNTDNLACIPPSGPLSCIAEITERTESATPATTPVPST